MWARRYNVPCTSCHYYPSLQLKAAGLQFLRRGHRGPNDTFDKDLTHLVSAHGAWTYEVQEGQPNPFPSPELHLNVGGALSPLFSSYMDTMVNSDFEVLYVQLTTPGESSYFTARAGKINPTLVRNWGDGLMASASTPLITTASALDNNPFTPNRDSYGFDVGGRIKDLFVQAGVVNGVDVPGQATVNNHKDFFATAEFNLPDSVSGVALYWYRGGYDLGDPSTSALVFDRYDREAAFANYTDDTFRAAGGYMFGRDTLEAFGDRTLHGYFLQTDGYPVQWAVPFLRYDELWTEDAAGVAKVQKGTVGCAFQLFRTELTAGRLVVEVARERVADVETNSALLHVMWSL